MKTAKYITAFAAVCLMSVSCLKEKSYMEIDKGSYMNDASEAETVLLGIYRDMEADGMYGYYYSLYFTLPTDEAKVEGSSLSNFRNVPSNAYTSTEDEIQIGWQKMYNAIYDANNFIETISSRKESFSEKDLEKAEVYIAEARALRALFYFELVRWYGNVALITSTSQSRQHPSTFVQEEPAKVYGFIVDELHAAEKVLPYSNSDAIRSDNSFRMSKGAVQGLLTKVFATWAGYPLCDSSKWAEAAAVADTLIKSGNHALLGNFRQLWKNSGEGVWDGTESLIEVSFYSQKITGTTSQDASGRIGKWNGVQAATGSIRGLKAAGNWRVVPMFLRDWEGYADDLRWGISFADYKYTADKGKTPLGSVSFEEAMKPDAAEKDRKAFNTNICPAKWDIEVYVDDANNLANTDFSNVNWYVLRYADVLLLYAEAVNEANNGPTAEAYEAVNMVRRRGYGMDVSAPSSADLPDGLSYDEFRNAVRNERAHELAFEGHRRQDLIRWGIYYETIIKTYMDYAGWHSDAPDTYLAGLYTIKGKNELLPIPQRELDLCSQFKQNPGW